MKICILGDLHFGARSNNESIMYHQKRFFDFFFEYLKDNDIKHIFQLGDVFDNRRTTNSRALKFAYEEFFDRLEGIDFYSLVGNHDSFWKETTSINTGNLLLRQYKNVKIFDKPETVFVGNKSFDFIPWVCEENKTEITSFIAKSKSNYCLGHFEINNFEVMPGIPISGAMDEITFQRYDRVFSGHIHLSDERENIIYVGTPYQITWTDTKRPKSFIVLDTETGKYEIVTNKNTCFYVLEYDDANKIYSDLSSVNLTNCFIKLLIYNKNEPFLYNNYINKILTYHPADIRFIENKIIGLTEEVNVDVAVKSMEDIISDYISSSTYNNKEELIKYMVGLYNEAVSSGSNL